MNETQRRSAAKFLYDVAKIVLTIAVISNLFSQETMNIIRLISGTVATGFTFYFAYLIERGINNEHG